MRGMISYLKSLPSRYKLWKSFQRLPKSIVSSGRVPSETYQKYPPTTTFNGLKVLNLGCGTSVFAASNVTNVDGTTGPGVNLVWDLSKTPLPFADESFDRIVANHVLEHVPNWFECMKEMARVVKVGGIIEVWVPPVSSDSSFTYRDHINSIGLMSFSGCRSMPKPGCNLWAAHEQKDFFEDLEIVHCQQRAIVKWWTTFAPDFVMEWMSMYLRNVISEEGFIFRRVPR